MDTGGPAEMARRAWGQPQRHGKLMRRAGVHSNGWGSATMSMPDRVEASQRRHRWAGYPIAVL